GAGELVRAVDHQLLVRLEQLPVLAAMEDDLRPPERELVALAAHRLREDRQRKLAPAEYDRRVGFGRLLDAEADVLLELLLQALGEVPARDVLAREPRQRRVVDAKLHGERRLVDTDARERRRVREVEDRLPDLDVRKA